jgi:uncharacterized protein (DUF1501 family)
MQRKDFLRLSGTLGLPLLLNNIPMKAFSGITGLEETTDCAAIRDRVWVIVQMEGGNDGINTVVSKSQYDLYRTNRPTIHLPETGANSIINLDASLAPNRQVGLHPVMTGFKDLYDAGKLNIVHGTGYANNNRSHFKATDHWLTGGDSTPGLFDLGSGVLGRYLDYTYPGAVTSPTPWMPDPLGLELGEDIASLAYKTNGGKYASVLLTSDASTFSTSVAGLSGPAINPLPASQMGSRIQHVHTVEQSINAYSTRITNTYNAGANLATYPANSYLAYQLKTVARILKGGSKTRIFLVHTGGYDTHDTQSVAGAVHTGGHANLLKNLADSLKAFQTDLQLLGIEDRVITSTFTEFGRTVDENGNRGTDHGGVNPMFIIGKGVKPGTTGNPPDMNMVVDRACVDLQTDYRSVYAAILQDFMGAGNTALAAANLGTFAKSPVISTTAKAASSCYTDIILPIRITNLDAIAENDGSVTVLWKTRLETETDYFEVERNNGSGDFLPVGRKPAAGNSSVTKSYQLNDPQPLNGINQYRLKQVDKNGDFAYYGPVVVNIRNKQKRPEVRISPNPANSFFNIVIQMPYKDIRISTTNGNIRGNVMVNIQTATGFKYTQQVVCRK